MRRGRAPGLAPRAVVAALLLAAGANAGAVDAAAAAIVEQPRPFGHVVGDVVTQRVLLVEGGRPLEPATLPAPSRLGVWFERRAARIERAADGRRWLEVDYQIVTAPAAQAVIRLPAWDLADRSPGRTLHVAAWPIGVTALTTKAAPGTAAWQVRPDRPPPPIPLAALRSQFLLSSVALAAGLLAWIAWFAWRGWRASSTLPFATAWRALRGLDDAHPDAWRALHGAFDRTACEVMREATLPRLFERAPHLAPLRGPIGRFYAQSAARFFGAAPADEPSSCVALCRDLRRLERRHER
ncbi:MAG: calcium incorporation protein MxaA [Betaproteobacteria bacterium]